MNAFNSKNNEFVIAINFSHFPIGFPGSFKLLKVKRAIKNLLSYMTTGQNHI